MARQMPPDLAARRILLAAYAYYVLDVNFMDDGEYDRLSRYVADNWGELHEDRKFNLISPADTRITGIHFRFTVIAVHAAYAQYKKLFGDYPDREIPEDWRRIGSRRFVTVTGGISGRPRPPELG